MAAGVMLVLVLLISLIGGLILYSLVRAEHDQRETMDRDQAEQAARRDTSDRNNSDPSSSSDKL